MGIHLGIGSWTDPEYTGILFPKGVRPEQRLAEYAKVFDHVEVNSSYYATPRRETVANWAKQTPAGFTFHIKLHRAFSQSPAKTATGSELGGSLVRAIEPLVRAKKLGVLLLVMPPSFGPERRRLEELDPVIKILQPHPLAVELRHSDWVKGPQQERTLDYFGDRGLVWVAVDMPRIKGSTIMPAIDAVTHPRIAYLRLHGRNKRWLTAKSAEERHRHSYTPLQLKDVATRIAALGKRARDVYVVANNHASDYAPQAALRLQRLVGNKRSGGIATVR